MELTNRINVSAGATPKIRDNDGYNTESEGATTVSNGGTISHGLVSTPTVISVNGSVSGEFVSVTSKNATTFIVSIRTHSNNPGSTQTIYWRASI